MRKRHLEVKRIVSGLQERWLEGLPSGEKGGLLRKAGLGRHEREAGQDKGARAETGESQLA